MSRSTQELLLEALAHLELTSEYADGEDLDQLIVDAICMRLSVGIEVCQARAGRAVSSVWS